MSAFIESKNKVSLLGRAEYRYNSLVSDFAEHYLELKRAEWGATFFATVNEPNDASQFALSEFSD